jgi:hypothetical protein
MEDDELIEDLKEFVKSSDRLVFNFNKYKVEPYKKYTLNELLKIIYGDDLPSEYLIFSDRVVYLNWEYNEISHTELFALLQLALTEYEYILFSTTSDMIFREIVEPNLDENDKSIMIIENNHQDRDND